MAEGTATRLHRFENKVRRVGRNKTYHCDPTVVILRNNTPQNLTLLRKKMKGHS